MNQKTIKVIILITIGVLCIFAGVMFFLIKDNSTCAANPLTFGAKYFAEKDFNILCSCDLFNMKDNSNGRFYFDDKGIYPENPNFNKNSLNLSLP